jgi:hypothetical protein
MNYSPELKDALLRRMLPPNNESISQLAKEEGISAPVLLVLAIFLSSYYPHNSLLISADLYFMFCVSSPNVSRISFCAAVTAWSR